MAWEASTGFPLVGWMKCSGVCAANLRPPALHVSAFETMAAAHSARTIASVGPTSDTELDEQVWTATLAEVEGGTLEGPFEVESLPKGHVASPRFGTRQGSKVRPIDNLSVSGLNSTVGLPERLQVDTIDEVAAMIKRCMQLHGSHCNSVGREDLRSQKGISPIGSEQGPLQILLDSCLVNNPKACDAFPHEGVALWRHCLGRSLLAYEQSLERGRHSWSLLDLVLLL